MKNFSILALAAVALLGLGCGRHGTIGDIITIADTTETVAAGGYTSWGCPYWVGGRMFGTFSTESGDIHFMVMDDANWEEWKMGQPSQAEVDITDSSGQFDIAPDESGMWSFVLDNTGGATDVTVTVKFEYEEPSFP